MNRRNRILLNLFTFLGIYLLDSSILMAEETRILRISWGCQSPVSASFYVQFHGENVTMSDLKAVGLESGDDVHTATLETTAGGGDIDGAECTLHYSPADIQLIDNLHTLWNDLIRFSDPDTAHRLQQDPAYRPDSRKITVQMNPEGTRGLSFTIDQLLQTGSFWVPSLDLFLSIHEPPVSFEEHLRSLEMWKGKRILDRIHQEPEADLQQFTSLWEDMGSPAYLHPNQPAPGHIVGLAWDSSIPKFGIDRGAGIWNDYGNPDRFRLWFDFGDLSRGIQRSWKEQRLEDGLPILTTALEENGFLYRIEQLAFPLSGPPPERRGDISMALISKVEVTNTKPEDRRLSFQIHHQRVFSSTKEILLNPRRENDAFVFEETETGRILFSLEGSGLTLDSYKAVQIAPLSGNQSPENRMNYNIILSLPLAARETKEWIVKLPSPLALPLEERTLLALDYSQVRSDTLRFWSDYTARGAQFHVPEKTVNDLFRANLWHSLRLPRRHGASGDSVKIDLPYSNFAYDQTGTPWPVNQAVYVDNMIYDRRGYHDLALEEILAIFRNNQQLDGRIAGFANWGVYTPSMLYVAAEHYLLTRDRSALERLLPYVILSMDWCLKEIQQSAKRGEPAADLIRAPLNDLTGEGIWAFTQAYVYAGLNRLGIVLQEIGHPRAEECCEAARRIRKSIERAFARATMLSPLVPLRDRTWIPYVPCEALTPQRLLEQWYPADVDTGALHLLRLEAIPANGPLAESLLNDHEDNLFLHGWGMANEPVYNPQSTAYLLRDDPEAVIRSFYSYTACAFSHSALEPVEHRWSWGQYFGPPSTDGAWFDLYRNMLIRESANETLTLMQAAPRKWLAEGDGITIERAPTYYGPLSYTAASLEGGRQIAVEIQTPNTRKPKTMRVRLRHPHQKPIQSVTVNGKKWRDFNVQKEWIEIPNPAHSHYSILAQYQIP